MAHPGLQSRSDEPGKAASSINEDYQTDYDNMDGDDERIIDLSDYKDEEVVEIISVTMKETEQQKDAEEEFVIVKNPGFHGENFHDENQRNDNEIEILPPPRTLDDPPLTYRKRRTKKSKGRAKERKTKAISDFDDLDLSLVNMASRNVQAAPQNLTQRFQRNCKKKFIDYSEENIVICDTSLSVKSEEISVNGQKLEKSHLCDMCDASFTKALGLSMHKRQKHSIKIISSLSLVENIKVESPEGNSIEQYASGNKKQRKPKLIPCPKCDRKFSLRGNMRRHLSIHLGNALKFECPQCGKLCTSKAGLTCHIRFIHTGERPYACKQCPAAFVSKSDLNRHQSKHSDEKRYKCSDCGKGFKQKAALVQHIHVKMSEKLWQCEVCAKKFSTKSLLKNHMVKHTKIKLYECETCQRRFSHKMSLEAHMRVHAGLMPFSCSVCGKKFAHPSNRNRHMRTVHGKSVKSHETETAHLHCRPDKELELH